jgi:hypothetical protein
LNIAVAPLSASMISEHGPVPEQAPVHPAKLDPLAAAGVSVRT